MSERLQIKPGEIEVGKIKTSISVDENLWRNFSIAVIQKEGGRKVSETIELLIEQYLKKK
jgi:hypothetical protein